MAERKLYKTKLCVLYQKGRCTRSSCSFAHGDAELRRSFGAYNGVRDSQVGDLRDKLHRRLSPQRRYSPGRDARHRHKLRVHSPSRSLEKKSDRKRRKKQHLHGQIEFSGSLKTSDGTEDRVKEGQVTSYDSKAVLQEQNHVQLQEVQVDINMLEHKKRQLEIHAEEKVQTADILSSRIKELETQLQQEKEECRRKASKIKKFIKAHNHHSRIQDELKRSQAQLQRLGDQLGSDAAKAGGNEEDSSINIMSDGETTNYHLVGPQNDLQTISPPNKKNLHGYWGIADESMLEANLKDGGQRAESIPLRKVSRWYPHPDKSNVDIEVEAVNNGNSNHGPVADEGKLKRRKNVSTSLSSSDKVKSLRSVHVLPSTSMAAHAIDEDVEIEVEKIDEIEVASAGIAKGATRIAKGLPDRLPPPPPPVPHNAYLQYAGDDENVDVVG